MVTREQLQKAVVEKAAKDPVFKKQLLTNPNLAIKKLLKELKGVTSEDLKKLEKVNFKAAPEKSNEIVIVLPHQLFEERELSSEELKKVSGGILTWVLNVA